MPEGMKEKEMIDLLLKRFIKDYDKTKNPEVRTRYGVFAGIVGIISNLILFLAKILAGVLTASVLSLQESQLIMNIRMDMEESNIYQAS